MCDLRETFAYRVGLGDPKVLPFKPQCLGDFGAKITKMHFVFNINDDLIKEQNFFWKGSQESQDMITESQSREEPTLHLEPGQKQQLLLVPELT